jgi:hypothetical protein
MFQQSARLRSEEGARSLPVTISTVRYPGIKIHDTRVIRLMEVLLHGGATVGGWTAKPIREARPHHVSALREILVYDLRFKNLSAGRIFAIKEKVKFDLSVDAFNPFNFVRWGAPNTTLTSAAFGTVTTAANGRTLQVNAALRF